MTEAEVQGPLATGATGATEATARPGTLPRCAVVVVNYGSSALLAENLAAVSAQSPDLAVVVVDNFTSASEATAVTDLARTHGWELVLSPTNLGFGAATNLGAAAALTAGAEQLLVLNPDARIDAADLRRLREVVAADALVLAAPVVRAANGRIWSDGTDLQLDTGAMRATRKRPAGSAPRVEMWLSGACLLLSRTLWERLGGFDEDYFLYWEDVDLCRRARAAGARLEVVREASAVHDEGGTQGEGGQRARSSTYYYYNVRNRLLFAAQHLGPADRRRWVRRAVPEAYAILLRGGRRQLLRPAPWRAAAGGTLAGLGLMLRTRAARAGRSAGPGPLRLLQSFPEPRPTTNPYLWMLRRCLEEHPGVALDTFSWRRALTGRYDVFHAHWPEILVDGATPARKLVRQVLFVAFLLRLRLTGTAVVRTLHNVDLPSGISRREVLLLRWFERWTTLVIRLNPETEVPDRPHVTVVHGHYRDWFARYPRLERVPGRMAYFGLIRRYKAVDTLVTAFRETQHPELSLFVGGRPSSEELRQELTALAAPDLRISTRLEFLSDADLVAAASAAQLVVLPYREMHNSGGVLAALSLDRPVLVPDNEVNRRLAHEVGPGWVHRYRGRLDARALSAAVRATAVPPPEPPDLSQREWGTTAERHLAAYLQAVALLGRGRRPAAAPAGRASA